MVAQPFKYARCAQDGAGRAGPAFVNPLRGKAAALEGRVREQDRAGTNDDMRLLELAFDACDKDDGESDGNISAKTAALMVHCVLPLVETAGLLEFIQQLHAADFSEEAWASGEPLFAAQRGDGKGSSTPPEESEQFGDRIAEEDGYAGEYRVLHAAATRETSDFGSEQKGQLEPGEVLRVHEGLILPSGKVRLRSDKGWFSLISNAGDTLVERTDGDTEIGGDIAVLDDDTAAPEAHEIPINLEQVQRLVEMGFRLKDRNKKKQDDMHHGLLEILMVANVFSSVDVNHTGRIDLLGLSQLSQNLKIGLTVSQLKAVWGIICVGLEGDDTQKGAQRVSFEQFFEGLLHLRQLVADGDTSRREISTCATFRQRLLQRGSGPAAQVDVLLASLNQQRLDAARVQRAIEERVAADTAAAAAAAKEAVEVLARQSREQAAAEAAKLRAAEDAAEEQRRHEEEWLETMERNQQEMGAEYSAWVENNRNKLVEEPVHMVRRCFEGVDLETMLRGVEMLRGVFAAADVLEVHRLDKKICALLLTALGATASVSSALFQMEKAIHAEGEPVGTGIHHGHSLDFNEFFHIMANQKDEDRLRVARLDEDEILGLQAIGTAFVQIDTDGSGSIDRQEFDVLCAAMGAYEDPQQDVSGDGKVREMWLKLCGRKVELPFADFLAQTIAAREQPLGRVFYEQVVWPLRATDATEMAAGWHVMEAQEQAERSQNPNWHHLDSTEEEEEEEEEDKEPIPEIETVVPAADSYIDQARNPLTVRRTIDHLRVAFDALDESDSMTDGTLGSNVTAFVLALLVREWSMKTVAARIDEYNLGQKDTDDSEGNLRQLSFDDVVFTLICPDRAGKFEIERYLGESEQRLVDIACVAGCAMMFMAMDTDRSGKVDFSEFQVMLAACEAGIDTREQRELWSSFERDRSNQCSMLGMMIGLQKLDIIGPVVRAAINTTPNSVPHRLLQILTTRSVEQAGAGRMRGFRSAFRELVIEPFIPELPDDGLEVAASQQTKDESSTKKKKDADQSGGRFRKLLRTGLEVEETVDVGVLCEQSFAAVAQSSMFGVPTRASKVGVRRLLYVVQAMAGIDTAMKFRDLVEQMPPSMVGTASAAPFVDALSCKEFLQVMMELQIRPNMAAIGHKRVVACANLYASLDGGSTDGVLSKANLTVVARFHSGRKAERWVREVFWRSVDRQGAAAGVPMSLTLEELLDGLIDLADDDMERFYKVVLCYYVDISEGTAARAQADAALAAIVAQEEKEMVEDDMLKGASAMLARDSMHQTFDTDDVNDGVGGVDGAFTGGLGGMLGAGMGDMVMDDEAAAKRDGTGGTDTAGGDRGKGIDDEEEDSILGQDMNANMVRQSLSNLCDECLLLG